MAADERALEVPACSIRRDKKGACNPLGVHGTAQCAVGVRACASDARGASCYRVHGSCVGDAEGGSSFVCVCGRCDMCGVNGRIGAPPGMCLLLVRYV